MGALWPTLRHQPGETPASLASRLAALHAVPVREFCRDMGIMFQAIVDGARDAVEALADLAGVARAPLVEEAIVRTGDRAYAWRGEDLTRSSLRRSQVMACPACLGEDVAGSALPASQAAYGRAVWQLRQVRTCPRHGTALSCIAEAANFRLLHDFAGAAAPFLALLAEGRVVPAQQRPSALEHYLLGRLADGPAGTWLDAMPWHAAAEACEVIGAVAAIGPDTALRGLTDEDRHAAGDAGFAIASQGEEGILRLLGSLDDAYPRSRAATEGPQAVYGALHKWLREGMDRTELDPLRALMTGHIVRTTPVGPGDMVFGKPVDRRVVHSIRTASLEWERHPKRLRKILRASGMIGPETDGLTNAATTFDAAAARDVLERAARSITQAEAEEYMNAGRVQTALLVRERLIAPFVSIGTEGRRGKLVLALADLDDFLGRLLARAVPVTSPTENEVDIPQAAHRSNCSAAEIVRLILDGRLGWVGRKENVEGYRSVLVRIEDVKPLVRGAAIEGCTAHDLEDRLRTNTKVVKALIAHGLLPTFASVNPINRCPITLIAEQDVRAFQEKYVSLTEAARARGMHLPVLKKELSAAGIEPALTADVYGAAFYLRAQF